MPLSHHNHHHHHHHVVPLAWISLTLSRHFCLSFIASGRSSGLHPVSSHRRPMYVPAGRPAFAWPYVVFHRSTSLMSSSLLLEQCPACLVQFFTVISLQEFSYDLFVLVLWHINTYKCFKAKSCICVYTDYKIYKK